MDSLERRRATETAVRLTMERRTELLAYARAIVGEASLAEDVFQEALVVAVEKGPELPAQDYGRWIREVVRRTALGLLHKQKRHPRAVDRQVLEAMEPAWQALDGRWGADRGEALRRCLEKLSPKARRLLEERYERNATGIRLAERVGLSLKSAYATLTRIHRALEACVRQGVLEQEGGA